MSTDQPEPDKHTVSGEGNLHDLTDDEYFNALPEMPPVYDAEGNQVTGLFEDVVDAREAKRAEAARLAEEKGDDQ